MRKHTSARSFFIDLSMDSPPGPLLEIELDVKSNMQTHDVRVKIPADSQQALSAILISAFRNLNQLIVHAGEEFFNSVSHTNAIGTLDSYKFRIKFSPREVDVAAATALVDSNGVLLIRVQKLRGWLHRVQVRSLLCAPLSV